MTYSFDPELALAVPAMPLMELHDLEAARSQTRELEVLAPPPDPASSLDVAEVRLEAARPDRTVRCRVYRPAGAATSAPGLLFLHGGGFVVGSIDLEDAAARHLADELDAVVVSVDYRLAPEHPYPAGLDDCLVALRWLADPEGAGGVDAARVAVCGDSAGGGLAAALALRCRDEGGPALAGQSLGIPVLDDRLTTPSMRAFDDTPVWRRTDAEISWRHYLGATEPVPPYAAPARAEELSGLPRAFVAVCEFDPLRDEGLAYAARLVQSGVQTELHLYPGTFHGSSMVAGTAIADQMVADRVTGLRRMLAGVS